MTAGVSSFAVEAVTAGLPSILDEWLSVIPVIANMRVVTREIAPLIQCHVLSWRIQSARRLAFPAETTADFRSRRLTGHPSCVQRARNGIAGKRQASRPAQRK
jgi:hypothetical protein